MPAGAAAEVGEQGLADRGFGGFGEGGDAHDDPRSAEAALAAAVGAERFRPAVGAVETLERRDGPTGDPADRRDARDARLTVDPHRAAPALALRAAAVLRRPDAEMLAQGVEQRAAGEAPAPATRSA